MDALCLERSNEEEMNQHVHRMRDIYDQSYKATIWLGEGNIRAERAMDELGNLGQQLLLEAETGLLSSAPDAPANGWHDPEVELPYLRETWSDIEFLLTHRWFRNISV